MSETTFPHALIPPPAPFPTWQGDEEGPLVYLAWGDRDYSRFPLPIHSNPGWTYWVLLQGTAEVITPETSIAFEKGEGFRCGPDCPFGFAQKPGAYGQVLVWIWRHPPRCFQDLDASQLQRVSFGAEQQALLKDLHTQTRLEIFQPRPHSEAALEHLSGLMEIQFARAQSTHITNMDEILVQRAKQWMLEHISEQASMQDLAHYLGVSVMRLHRLFHAEFETSPGSVFHDLKMKHCARLLRRPGYTVKRVAYENGYRHANDFSRAFKKAYGVPPSQYEG